MKQRTLKNRILLLVLALLLLIPTSITLAKYTAVNDVGTVTLTITGDPPVSTVLDKNWQSANGDLLSGMTKLVVDSFKAQSANLNGLKWDSGTPIGAKDTEGNFTNGVRLFAVDNTAYILAKGIGTVVFPKNSTDLFSSLSTVQEIQFNSIDTSNVTRMGRMFKSCNSLTSLNLSRFDTSNVTHMNDMFSGCQVLTTLNFGSDFKTSNVISMSSMFKSCGALTELDLSGFDTRKVKFMPWMFSSCSGLKSLDLTSFDTSNVTDMCAMFYFCTSLETLNLSSFGTTRVTPMTDMFTRCDKLKQVTLGANFRFDTEDTTSYLPAQSGSNITGANGLWYTDQATGFTPVEAATHQETVTGPTTYYAVGTEAPAPPPAVLDKSFKSQIPETATKLVLGSWNDLKDSLPENTTWGSGIIYVGEQVNGTYSDQVKLFMGADGTTAYVLAKGSLPVTFPEDSGRLFSIYQLTDIQFKNIDTLNVEDMWGMFHSCSKLDSLDLSSFNTQNVSHMGSMFYGCRNLASLNVSSFDTRNVNNMGSMFYGCSNLTSLDLHSFNTKYVTGMGSMFRECSKLTSLDFSSFYTLGVKDMSYMFYGCSNLAKLTWGQYFIPSIATSMSYMFYGCSELTYLDLSRFQSNKNFPVSSYGMYTGCNKLEKVKYGRKFTKGGILPTPTSDNIPGADGKWYIDSETGFTPEEVQSRHSKELNNAVTYYAVASKAPQP